jgi:hypothetical protein
LYDRVRRLIFGFGKSSTLVMPSVMSGTYSPGVAIAVSPEKFHLSTDFRVRCFPENTSAKPSTSH